MLCYLVRYLCFILSIGVRLKPVRNVSDAPCTVKVALQHIGPCIPILLHTVSVYSKIYSRRC